MKIINKSNHPCVMSKSNQPIIDSKVDVVDICDRTPTKLLIVVKNMGNARIKYDTPISKYSFMRFITLWLVTGGNSMKIKPGKKRKKIGLVARHAPATKQARYENLEFVLN